MIIMEHRHEYGIFVSFSNSLHPFMENDIFRISLCKWRLSTVLLLVVEHLGDDSTLTTQLQIGDARGCRSKTGKISTVKEHLSRQMVRFINSAILMKTLLDLYLNQADPREILRTPSHNDQHVARGMAPQNLIVTCRSSLNQLTIIAHDHSRYCSSPLFTKKETQKIHASIVKLGYRRLGRTQQSFFWESSPQLPNGNYLVNDRMFHGYMFGGMHVSHYNRFVDGAGLGVASRRSQKSSWICMPPTPTTTTTPQPQPSPSPPPLPPPHWGNVQWWQWDSITWGNGIIWNCRGARKWWWRMAWHWYTNWCPSWAAPKCQGYKCCVHWRQKS